MNYKELDKEDMHFRPFESFFDEEPYVKDFMKDIRYDGEEILDQRNQNAYLFEGEGELNFDHLLRR